MAEVKYTQLEHWIPKQAEAEKAMLAEFEAGNYTIENPLVKYNPYFINPLAAVVLFNDSCITNFRIICKLQQYCRDQTLQRRDKGDQHRGW